MHPVSGIIKLPRTMFDIGFWELCVIGVVLLLVLGPERMPEVARQIGYWVARARRTVNNLRAEMKRELDALPTKELTQAAKLAKEGISDIKAEMGELSKDLEEKVGADSSEIEDVANTRLDEAADTAESDDDAAVTGEAAKKGAAKNSSEDKGAENNGEDETAGGAAASAEAKSS